jgi:hypothetical protein
VEKTPGFSGGLFIKCKALCLTSTAALYIVSVTFPTVLAAKCSWSFVALYTLLGNVFVSAVKVEPGSAIYSQSQRIFWNVRRPENLQPLESSQ